MTTIEEVQERFDALVYFDKEELMPVGELDWETIYESPELTAQLISDMMFVNRMNTIARNYEWRERQISEFKKNELKRKLTDPNAITNEFGEVMSSNGNDISDRLVIGTKMTPEEWDLYEKFYDTIFNTEIIDGTEGTE